MHHVTDTHLSQLNDFLHVSGGSFAAYPCRRPEALLWLQQWRHFPETNTRKPLEVFPSHEAPGDDVMVTTSDVAGQKLLWRLTRNSGFV